LIAPKPARSVGPKQLAFLGAIFQHRIFFIIFLLHQIENNMANTYTKLYIQLVFAVKHRESLIRENFRENLQMYLAGIARNNRHKLLSVYSMPDHTHIFLGLHPDQSISSLASDLKSNSSRWINSHKFTKFHFNWQDGYGAFSYHRDLVPVVGHYIDNQVEHHKKRTFREEYLDMLREFDIEFDEKYLFEFFE
jgi:REP element-mobilizing transposase RayT